MKLLILTILSCMAMSAQVVDERAIGMLLEDNLVSVCSMSVPDSVVHFTANFSLRVKTFVLFIQTSTRPSLQTLQRCASILAPEARRIEAKLSWIELLRLNYTWAIEDAGGTLVAFKKPGSNPEFVGSKK